MIRYADLLEKPFGMTHQVKPGSIPRVKPRISAHRTPRLANCAIESRRFPFMPVNVAFPRQLLVATGHDCAGIKHGLLRRDMLGYTNGRRDRDEEQ